MVKIVTMLRIWALASGPSANYTVVCLSTQIRIFPLWALLFLLVKLWRNKQNGQRIAEYLEYFRGAPNYTYLPLYSVIKKNGHWEVTLVFSLKYIPKANLLQS